MLPRVSQVIPGDSSSQAVWKLLISSLTFNVIGPKNMTVSKKTHGMLDPMVTRVHAYEKGPLPNKHLGAGIELTPLALLFFPS